jgi:phosphoglucomutase
MSSQEGYWKKVESGFAALRMPAEHTEAALKNLDRWLTGDEFSAYQPQLHWLIETEKWNVLLDSFYRVLPFGTGGRRGPVGIGTNRFNPLTLKSSVQGHIKYLLQRYPEKDVKDLRVVIAFDVRCFKDLRRVYNPDLPNPLVGMTSKNFAHLAAQFYTAHDVTAFCVAADSPAYVSTPELSYLIRRLDACGGLNISASHNHPDDNGGKFFGAHGGQEIPPDDQRMADLAEGEDPSGPLGAPSAPSSANPPLPIPAALHQEYVDLNVGQSLNPSARSAKVVFTPLHGTGGSTVGEVLVKAGFKIEPVVEQMTPDGSFPTVPFRAPNPEVPESMERGIELARQVHGDLVLACDPDADRIGACSPAGGSEYRFINGNEIAVILTHYKLDSLRRLSRLPPHPLVIKTEVTTNLLRPIAEEFGATLVGDLLVGFKYHAHVLNEIERTGHYKDFRGTLDDFVLATEESHGILVTPKLRDKDAAGAALLLAELASQLRDSQRTLVDYLDDIYLRYGYFSNRVTSMVMAGAQGSDDIQKIQDTLRKKPLTAIAGLRVVETIDHQDPNGPHGPILSTTDLVGRNVLAFTLEDGSRVILRPSGTEPKNKTYTEVKSAPLGMGASREELNRVKQQVNARAQHIADDITLQMLSIVGIDLPQYALRISGLVALNKRVSFVREFLPSLEAQARDLSEGRIADEAVSRWIDENLWTYGEDARGLVAGAIHAYLEIERHKAADLGPAESAGRIRCIDAMATFFAAVS